MLPLSKKVDKLLLDLAWSLWTELGVAGVIRRHQNVLITLEELIILTIALSDVDPRLRDESLDWCSQYHNLFSISRLKTLMKSFEGILSESFSIYSVTLNFLTRANWPVFRELPRLQVSLSHKSCLRPNESPALLNIRARSIFGAGARADLVTFFLTHNTKSDFAVSDLVEIGYTKRNLAEILEQFNLGGLFDRFMLRNQYRYSLAKNDNLLNCLKPIPKHAPSWQLILEVILPLRDCIKRVENSSESTQTVEIRNLLIYLQKNLQRLNFIPPPFQTNFHAYLNTFSGWLLETTSKVAQGHFS